MRLQAITVRNYRRHKELRVDLDAARTLIGGANETGKSTLVEAAHRALFLKARGTSEMHRRMNSLTHAGKPEVELEFEAGPHRYSLMKCFKGASGSIRLAQAGGASWQGDEAEEKLAQLLKTGDSNRKPPEQWGHLWVWQGSSANDPLTQAEAERDSLVQRLQAQGGAAVIQSALDTSVAARFASQVEEIFKANGDPKTGSDYGRAIQAEAEARQAEELARSALENLQQAVIQHEQATRQMAEAEEALKNLEAGRTTLEERAAQITLLTRQEEAHLRLASEAQRGHEARLLTEQKISQIRDSFALKQAELAPQTEKLALLKQAAATAAQNVAEAETEHQTAEKNLRHARSQHDLAQARATLVEKTRLHARLQERAQQMQALREQVSALESQLATFPSVNAAALKQLQQLDTAQSQAQAVLSNVATGIEVLSTETDIRLNDETLLAGQKCTLTAETELIVGSSRLRILPGGGNSLAKARQQAEETRIKLEDALAKLGVKTLTEASTAHAATEQLQADIKNLQSELKGLGSDKIPAELNAASLDLAAAEAELQRRGGSPLPEDPPSLTRTQKDLAEAEQQQKASQARLEKAASALKKAEAATAAHADSMRLTEREMTELEVHLSIMLDREGDDEKRAQALQEAQAQRITAEAALAATRQALELLQPQHLPAEQAQFDRAWKAQHEKKGVANEQRISAAALLQRDGSSDPAASLAIAEARTHMAITHREAVARQARALRHVHQLIQQEQQTLADQFTRPLADRVTGYLQRLFGNDVQVQVTMQGNSFERLTLSRAGQSAFSFDSLSNGAREQVAAAFRLALAEILAEAHDGCLPVVFDDAFAHSDPDRVQHLQRMLDLAASRGLQIILLTCTPGDYAMLGAKEIRL